MIEIVIPYFEKDAGLCALTVKSIVRFFDKDLIATLRLINNADNPVLGRFLFERDIRPMLGDLADRTQLHDAGDLGYAAGEGTDSYLGQQILKLAVADIVETAHYLILDAKNHFIKPVGSQQLFSQDGKPFSHYVTHGGYLATCLKQSLEFLGVTDIDPEAPALPTVTPYMMITQTVKDLMTAIRDQGCDTLVDAFQRNSKITEFLLYYAYIASTTGVTAQYEMGPRPYATLFARYPDTPKAFAHVLQTAQNADVLSFAVHSRRFAQLSADECEQVIDIWMQAGLFDTRDTALDFIKEHAGMSPLAAVRQDGGTTGDNKVKVGETGRLFIDNDNNGTLNQHLGKRPLSDQRLAEWRNCLTARQTSCADQGITYAMLVAPDNHAIYREELAALYGPVAPRPMLQMMALPEAVRPVYPLEALRAARVTHHVAHFTDSHWSGYGAYIAYTALMARLGSGLAVLPEAEVEVFDKVGPGDLGDKFDPPLLGRYTECVVRKPQARKIWNNGVNNRGHMSLWTSKNRAAPRGLLFTDSYGWKFQRFLAEAFSDLFIVHSPLLEDDPIAAFRPNVVVTLMAERFMVKVPDDRTDKTASAFAREKGIDDDVFPDFDRVTP